MYWCECVCVNVCMCESVCVGVCINIITYNILDHNYNLCRPICKL